MSAKDLEIPTGNVDSGAMTVVCGLCAKRDTNSNSWKKGDAHTEKEVRRALRGYAAKLIENGGIVPEYVIVIDIDGRGGGEGSDNPAVYAGPHKESVDSQLVAIRKISYACYAQSYDGAASSAASVGFVGSILSLLLETFAARKNGGLSVITLGASVEHIFGPAA